MFAKEEGENHMSLCLCAHAASIDGLPLREGNEIMVKQVKP